ncbi:MAG: putative lipopolysaccharide heptosyltransferase III [Deltaproteobacteria bacterium]|nr:putative lipopolysaccharide heptosyltransferase III [Deltaproteobacteria bacterium]
MLIKGKPDITDHDGAVLLIQLGDIGDVVLTMPALKALRHGFPDRKLIMCVRDQAGDLVTDCPWADETLTIKKNNANRSSWMAHQTRILQTMVGNRFYMAIDLRTGTRGGILTALSMAHYRIGRFAEPKALWRNRIFTHLVKPENERTQYAARHNLNILAPFDIGTSDIRPHLTVPQSRTQRALQLLRETGVPQDRPLIAIHPFSLWKYKEWRTNALIALIDGIKERYDVSIIITGAPEEAKRVKAIIQACKRKVVSLAGRTAIGDLPALLQRCHLLIGVDTAALHIAAAVGVPTVGIFGPSDPMTWAPRGASHAVITRKCSCQPCRQKGCQGSEFSRCLDELDSETVLSTVKPMLEKSGIHPKPPAH